MYNPEDPHQTEIITTNGKSEINLIDKAGSSLTIPQFELISTNGKTEATSTITEPVVSSSIDEAETSKTGSTASVSSTNRDTSTRREKRNRTTSKFHPYRHGPFTNEEKETILDALYKYGCNIDMVASCIQSRTREQVRDFITGWYRRVRKIPVIMSKFDKNALHKEPIELWLKKMASEMEYNEDDLPVEWLSRAFGYIALLEKHPCPEETGGVNFRNLYLFLELMMRGCTTKNLQYDESVFVLTSLRQLRERLNKIDFTRDEALLCQSFAPVRNTYMRRGQMQENRSSKTKDLEELLATKALNPLQFPVARLAVRERLKDHTQL